MHQGTLAIVMRPSWEREESGSLATCSCHQSFGESNGLTIFETMSFRLTTPPAPSPTPTWRWLECSSTTWYWSTWSHSGTCMWLRGVTTRPQSAGPINSARPAHGLPAASPEHWPCAFMKTKRRRSSLCLFPAWTIGWRTCRHVPSADILPRHGHLKFPMNISYNSSLLRFPYRTTRGASSE
jgi:hypothetical protein